MKNKAFTLAETLIVIGIIGVVAALTLPNLNHATGDKEKVTRVMKIYSSLTDAYDRAEVIYGSIDEWFKGLNDTETTTVFAKRITEFMKVSKDCGFDEGCWSNDPFMWMSDGSKDDKSYYEELKNYAYMVNLSDGMSLAFMVGASDGINDPRRMRIKVDIDGYNKGKTQYGSDIFEFNIIFKDNVDTNIGKRGQLLTDGIVGYDLSDSYGVTTWVVQNGNLDYLKCLDDLDWETQTSCK